MSKFSGLMKEGWHPKGKDGGKESWRGDFKGINQVAGWMGKERSPSSSSGGGSEHMSRPLATLKDPALFGPPPKNINYHGGIALPNEITPDRRGLGAPLTSSQMQATQRTQTPPQQVEEEPEIPAGPPVPYRADRTGLKTNHLPPPPTHKAIGEGATPPQAAQGPPKPKPYLPPRLPARRESSNASIATLPLSPPAYEAAVKETPASDAGLNQHAVKPAYAAVPSDGGLNQGAIQSLGNAGVSVPSLGVGVGEPNPWKAERSPSVQPAAPNRNQLEELQSRFFRSNTISPPVEGSPAQTQSPPPGPSQGTTFAQKQATLKTAQAFHNDPSKVTLADAQKAASVANNFRERHQESIAAGAKKGSQKASEWNKKYNLAGRMNNFLEQQTSPQSEQPPPHHPTQSPAPDASALSNRKPPPPPPPKKPSGLQAQSTGTHVPPPVPLGTKPSFG